MTFTVEMTRNGKPNILYKNYKYRESYKLKSGDIIWKCLGRNCGASIKTDADKTTVTVTNSKHSGPHPVTMRSISSPQPSRITSISLPTSVSSPHASIKSPLAYVTSPLTTDSSQHQSTSATTSYQQSPPVDPNAILAIQRIQSPSPSADIAADITAENEILRGRVTELKDQLQCVLDHSIESDIRLLEFTDQVFVSNTSQTHPPIGTSTADCGVQCNLPTFCKDDQCIQNRTLINSLRTTIDVLEAELQCLRKEAENCNCRGGCDEPGWTVMNRHSTPILTKNRFSALGGDTQTGEPITKSAICKKPTKKRKHKKAKLKKAGLSLTVSSKVSLPFQAVYIEGDSHSRGVAGLVCSMVTSDTLIEGVCKPGAKLRDVISDGAHPPGSCCVIIAGTNDLANGQQHNIYKNLECCIKNKLRSAKVVIATLPHRHDLPVHHPINEETALVNAYIEELSVRKTGIRVLDFNQIGRDAFTSHGMHLKPQHKRRLAELLLECLRGPDFKSQLSTRSSSAEISESSSPRLKRMLPTPDICEVTAAPRTLPYETFADAVKSQTPKTTNVNITKNCLLLSDTKKG